MALRVAAQVSLYPLRVPHLSPAIKEFVATLQQEGLEASIGPLSTFVEGDADTFFRALAKAFASAAQGQHLVMNLTVANFRPTIESP